MSPRSAIAIWIILLIFFLFDGTNTPSTPTHDVIDFFKQSLLLLSNSTDTHNSTYGAITHKLEHLFHAKQDAYHHQNITGFVHSRFTHTNTSRSTLFNQSILLNDSLSSPLDSGMLNTLSLTLSSVPTISPRVHWLKGYLRLYSNRISLDPLAFAKFTLPRMTSMARSEDGIIFRDFVRMQDLGGMVADKEMDAVVRNVTLGKLKEQIDALEEAAKHTETVQGEISTNYTCSFRGFFQLAPVPLPDLYTDSDETAPKLISSSLIYSPECGILLESDTGVGLPTSLIARSGKQFAFLLSIVTLFQIILTIRQMESYATPSVLFILTLPQYKALGRISHISLTTQIILDITTCLSLLTASITTPLLFPSFIAAAFLSFVLFSIFELRYGVDILSRRMTLEEGGFVRVYLYSAVVFMLVYQIAVQSTIVALVMGVGLHLFWIPQIVRNYRKNCRKALGWGYACGITLTRMFLPCYLLGYKESLIGFGEVYPSTLSVIFGGFLVQVLVLWVQSRLGPRAFVPKRFRPVVYDYHPVLSEDVESEGVTVNECAICFVVVDKRGTEEYMITPCQHIFHQECLEKWMDVKLECPICRSVLPVA